jgi:chemotaxis protein MotB
MSDTSAPPPRRRHKAHKHEPHGGAWKVALADFMTTLMAFFMVMWLTSQSPEARRAIAGYFRDPAGVTDKVGTTFLDGQGPLVGALSPAPMARGMENLKQLMEQIKVSITEIPEFKGISQHLEFQLTEEGLRISLIEDSLGIFFEAGRAIPTPVAARFLAVLGQQFATVPNRLVIEGHTDASPYGRTDYTNWELSADRANTARRIFEIGGTPPQQILEVRGHADRLLRFPNAPKDPRNRRVTVTLLYRDAARGQPLPTSLDPTQGP